MTGSGAAVTISDTAFEQSSADGSGGAIAVREDGALTVNGGSFSASFASTGGAIAITDTGSVQVTDATFTDNEAATAGAALYAAGGTLTATGVVFDGNLPDDWSCAAEADCTIETAD